MNRTAAPSPVRLARARAASRCSRNAVRFARPVSESRSAAWASFSIASASMRLRAVMSATTPSTRREPSSGRALRPHAVEHPARLAVVAEQPVLDLDRLTPGQCFPRRIVGLAIVWMHRRVIGLVGRHPLGDRPDQGLEPDEREAFEGPVGPDLHLVQHDRDRAGDPLQELRAVGIEVVSARFAPTPYRQRRAIAKALTGRLGQGSASRGNRNGSGSRAERLRTALAPESFAALRSGGNCFCAQGGPVFASP